MQTKIFTRKSRAEKAKHRALKKKEWERQRWKYGTSDRDLTIGLLAVGLVFALFVILVCINAGWIAGVILLLLPFLIIGSFFGFFFIWDSYTRSPLIFKKQAHNWSTGKNIIGVRRIIDNKFSKGDILEIVCSRLDWDSIISEHLVCGFQVGLAKHPNVTEKIVYELISHSKHPLVFLSLARNPALSEEVKTLALLSCEDTSRSVRKENFDREEVFVWYGLKGILKPYG